MHYVVEDTPLGTAGAVKLAEPFLGDERFVIISGDALTDIDLDALLASTNATARTARSRYSASPIRWNSAWSLPTMHAHHALSREAVLGRSLLRHHQHRHLRARAGDLRVHGSRQELRFLAKTSSRSCCATASRSTASLRPATGATSATCSSTSRPTTMRSPARCTSRFPGTQIRTGRLGRRKLPHRIPTRTCKARSCIGSNVTIERGAVIEELCAIGNSTIVAADAQRHAHGRVGRRLHRRARDAHRLHAGRSRDRQGPRYRSPKAP